MKPIYLAWIQQLMRMHQFSQLLGLASAALLIAAIAGCNAIGFHAWEWHQKLTVSVMTPEGMKVGKAVTSASIEFPPKWTGVGDAAGMQRGGVTGEAVVVDLGHDHYLFALLKDYTEWTAYTAFFPQLDGKALSRKELFPYLDRLVASTGQVRELAREHYPLLVTFDNISDPATVRRVDPGNLAASFGAGYRLNSISLSITDEPVTQKGVKPLLPWLRSYYSTRFDGQRFGTIKTSNPFANSLASGAFDTEKAK